MHFVWRSFFELSNRPVCGRGCAQEEESELQLTEIEEVKATTVNIRPQP